MSSCYSKKGGKRPTQKFAKGGAVRKEGKSEYYRDSDAMGNAVTLTRKDSPAARAATRAARELGTSERAARVGRAQAMGDAARSNQRVTGSTSGPLGSAYRDPGDEARRRRD